MTEASLPTGIRSLVDKAEETRELNPAVARDFLRDADISAMDLRAWADFGHPQSDSYGRMRLHDGGFLELEVRSWVDGDMSAIHSGGPDRWEAVRFYGHAEQAVFKVEDALLTTGERRTLPAGSVLVVARDLVHQMGNVGQEPYLTLHLRGVPGRRSGTSSNLRLYELDEGEVQVVDAGAFFDLPEIEVSRREAAPEADFPTYIRHQVELLKRMMVRDSVISRGSFQSRRQRRLAEELFAAATWHRLAEEWDAVRSGPSLRFDHYARVLGRELKAVAELQKRLFDAGLAQPVFDVVHLSELLAFSDPDRFTDGYLDLVSDAYSLGLSSLAAA